MTPEEATGTFIVGTLILLIAVSLTVYAIQAL
jgi:hypothetical protein